MPPTGSPPTFVRRVRRRLRDWWRGETANTFFDVRDPAERAALGVGAIDPPAVPSGGRHLAANVARQVWRLRPDLRDAFPLGLTPAGRREYADWLLRHGPADFGLTPAGVVAYLAELAADPAHGLATSYLTQPAWQRAVPDGLSRGGWVRLKCWLADRYMIRGRWLGRAGLPDLTPPAGPGVNVLTHYRHTSGLREEAIQLSASLRAAGFGVARRDLPLGFPCDCEDPADYLDVEAYPVSLLKIGAFDFVDDQYRRAGLYPRAGVYRIAGWSWELEEFPPEPVAYAASIDEVWTPSEFCAAAVRAAVTDRPVLAMRPGVAVPRPADLPRSAFGLPDGVFLFAFAFDMASVMERKNPLGLIRALRRAFRPDEPVGLVIKVTRGAARPTDLTALTTAATAAGVTVIDRILSRAESFALMAACDAYVSLHRAEGFGLTVAEAMLLGKPVIATDYSATTEFLTAATGLPVRYRAVPVGPGNDPYPPAATWAEPDEGHAAERMRWVYEHQDAARELGGRAKAHAAAVLSPAAAGDRMAARVRAISADAGRAGR